MFFLQTELSRDVKGEPRGSDISCTFRTLFRFHAVYRGKNAVVASNNLVFIDEESVAAKGKQRENT